MVPLEATLFPRKKNRAWAPPKTRAQDHQKPAPQSIKNPHPRAPKTRAQENRQPAPKGSENPHPRPPKTLTQEKQKPAPKRISTQPSERFVIDSLGRGFLPLLGAGVRFSSVWVVGSLGRGCFHNGNHVKNGLFGQRPAGVPAAGCSHNGNTWKTV